MSGKEIQMKFDEKYYLKKLKEMLDIDSVTGQCREFQDYLVKEIEALGFKTKTLRKGGVLVELGGKGEGRVISAHADTIGLMVRHINSDGTIKVCNVGGLHAHNSDSENIRIHSRKTGKVITGALQRKLSSVHVTPDKAWEELPSFDNIVAVVDADVKSAEDVRKLGIEIGDYIALDHRFTYENGYIKSRFIDDKAQVAILLEILRDMKKEKITPKKKTFFLIPFHEEIGLGGSWLPDDTAEFLAVDIACIGPEQTSDERKVSIFFKDTRAPYNYDMTMDLEKKAKKAKIDYVSDIFTPHYGTDADTSLVAGYDIRHAAIGPGTRATHGYERTHIDAIRDTYALTWAYIFD